MIIDNTASFKMGVSKVQDFGNFELSPMYTLVNVYADLVVFTPIAGTS